MAVKPIPDGYHTITPFLVTEGAAKVMDFLKKAFDATDAMECMKMADGTIKHAEIKVGDSIVMLSDATPQYPAMPSLLYVYVKDTDAAYRKALEAGATSIMEPADQFYGDRNAGVKDPAGNMWWIATHIEDLTPEEIQKRAAQFHKEKVHA